MGKAYRKLPFSTTDITGVLDKALRLYLLRLVDSRRLYSDSMMQLPSMFSECPLRLPDMVETRQVYWALFLSRMKQMEFFLSIGGEKGKNMNRQLINELKIQIKRFESDGVFKGRLTPDIEFERHFLFEEWKQL